MKGTDRRGDAEPGREGLFDLVGLGSDFDSPVIRFILVEVTCLTAVHRKKNETEI